MLSHSPLVHFNSDAVGEGRGETISVVLILLFANDPHQDANVDARESFGRLSPQPCHSSELGSRGW